MDTKFTLWKLAEERQRMVNFKLDTTRTEEGNISQTHSVRPSKEKYKCFSTCSKIVKNYNYSQYGILSTVMVVSILRVTASLETKNATNVEE